MGCKCIQQVNSKLAERGVTLDLAFGVTSNKQHMKLAVAWVGGKKPRGKSLPIVVGAYCPICGRKVGD